MKLVNSNAFKNCTIDVENMTLTEVTKDDEYVFDLHRILSDWSGIDGLSITIKKDTEVITNNE
jgi:hypothetical protein